MTGRPTRSPRGGRQEHFGGRIDDGDEAVRIDADHARRDAGEHRLREAAAAVDEVARGRQAVVLPAQFRRHLVEGLAEMGEVPLPSADRHLDVEIAGRDLVGRVDEAADRRHETIGEVEAEPDRGEKDDQRDQREHRREGDLDPDLLLLERLVDRDARLGDRRELDSARIDLAGDVEHAPLMGRQLEGRSEDVVLAREQAQRPGVAGILEIGGPRRRNAGQRPSARPSRRPCRRARRSSREESRGRSRGSS